MDFGRDEYAIEEQLRRTIGTNVDLYVTQSGGV